MATQKFIASTAPTPARPDAVELMCRERIPSMVAVLESIALNTLGNASERIAAARVIFEYGAGRPAVRVTQDINVHSDTARAAVIEHMSEAEDHAAMTLLVTQWARRMIPFDQWPPEVQKASGYVTQ